MDTFGKTASDDLSLRRSTKNIYSWPCFCSTKRMRTELVCMICDRFQNGIKNEQHAVVEKSFHDGRRRHSHRMGHSRKHRLYANHIILHYLVETAIVMLLLLPVSTSLLHGIPSRGLQRGIRPNLVAIRSDGSIPNQHNRKTRNLLSSFSRNFDQGDITSPSLPSDSISVGEVKELQRRSLSLLEVDNFQKSYEALRSILKRLTLVQDGEDSSERVAISESVDAIVQAFCGKAFVMPARYDAVVCAVSALLLQLSSAEYLAPRHRSVPKRTLTQALNALSSLNEVRRDKMMPTTTRESNEMVTKLSFRILQRLITGVGVRRNRGTNHVVTEREINQVLNVFSNTGKMDMAHRIVALQERTRHAPPLSPVAYSILLKGYGRQADLAQVEEVMRQAKKNKVKPDIILMNTLIDAYINCDQLEEAQKVFNQMRSSKDGNSGSKLFAGHSLPRPNGRTYNTILKGLANKGAYGEAVKLSEEIGSLKSWDPVTTNTLVRAAVMAKDFDAAERILSKRTLDPSEINPRNTRSHPNVEAYTQILDGYAKAGNLKQAIAVFQTMRQRGVEPNAVTYACLVAALGRDRKLDEAKRILDHMFANGPPPSVVTYNSLISALIEGPKMESDASDHEIDMELDLAVDQSLTLLRDMMKRGVRPNHVTAVLLVEAMGRCTVARVESASLLVQMMEKKRLIPRNDAQVTTALIRTCGMGGDIKLALERFRGLKTPDLIAINAFLDVCYRCDKHNMAVDTFHHYFVLKQDVYKLAPDVITYSVLMRLALKNGSISGLRQVESLYTEMKKKWGVCPDEAMIDILLKAVIGVAQTKHLARRDVMFVAILLRDAERLSWKEGQLERRKRAIRGMLGNRLTEAYVGDKLPRGVTSAAEDDELFKRKGWNKVDSGFRLWGKTSLSDSSKKGATVDKFLESHGWNNVDSGFRIL